MEDKRTRKGRYMEPNSQASTSYLNSLLQCCFYIPELREAICSWNNAGDSHIVSLLQCLLQELVTGNSIPTPEEIVQYLRRKNEAALRGTQEKRTLAEDAVPVARGIYQPEQKREASPCTDEQIVPICVDVVKHFQLLIEDKDILQQAKTIQSPTYHGGCYQMALEKCGLNLSSFHHKCSPPPAVYSVRSRFETLPRMLVIHLKKDQAVDIKADIPVPLSLTKEREKQLDADYELFAVCHHSRGIHGDWHVTEIKSMGNCFWKRYVDPQEHKIPERQICLGVQISAAASLLLYHRMNPYARPNSQAGLRKCLEPDCMVQKGVNATRYPSFMYSLAIYFYEKILKFSTKPSPAPTVEHPWGHTSRGMTVTAQGGYVGLRNQGSTCYLNSLLQCLFFTPELRHAILSSDHVGGSSIVCQLKTLFEQLKGKSWACSTKEIMSCLGVRNVHQQQDVAEYFRILMNKIIEDKQEIQQLYQVKMVHSITCRGCKKETPIPETPVLSLSLSLKGTSKDIFSVHEALADVQKENYFTGDEQLYCERCKSKQDATSRYNFKTLPQILVLNLKRYRFDGSRFRKLHCNVSVPFSLTLKLEKQSVKYMGFPLRSQTIHYELFAVCHHYRGIHGGHYVAEIKSYEDNCWYEFNDTAVHKVSGDQSTTDKKNSPTAYLLMYRMAKSIPQPRTYKTLQNQSCTGYLNSLLQCLFHTPELRDTILRCDPDGKSLVVGLLQKLFEEMMTPDSSSPSTEEITRALGMGNARRPLDVKECFQRLMNGITEAKGEIRQLYQVEMDRLITCRTCSYEEMLKDTTLSICAPLEEQNSNGIVISVAHALAAMQRERPFVADGQCYCQRCGSRGTTMGGWFKTLPQILVIHMERDRVGINAEVYVPLSLTLGTDKLDNEYALFGMCDHYAAEVKPLDESHWYRFSDTGVSEVPESEISLYAQSSATVSLLMYRKVKPTAQPGLDRTDDKLCSPESAAESRRNVNVALQDSPGANQHEFSTAVEESPSWETAPRFSSPTGQCWQTSQDRGPCYSTVATCRSPGDTETSQAWGGSDVPAQRDDVLHPRHPVAQAEGRPRVSAAGHCSSLPPSCPPPIPMTHPSAHPAVPLLAPFPMAMSSPPVMPMAFPPAPAPPPPTLTPLQLPLLSSPMRVPRHAQPQ